MGLLSLTYEGPARLRSSDAPMSTLVFDKLRDILTDTSTKTKGKPAPATKGGLALDAAARMSEEALEGAFDSLDVDGSGSIDAHEFGTLLRRLSDEDMSDEAMQAALDQVWCRTPQWAAPLQLQHTPTAAGGGSLPSLSPVYSSVRPQPRGITERR